MQKNGYKPVVCAYRSHGVTMLLVAIVGLLFIAILEGRLWLAWAVPFAAIAMVLFCISAINRAKLRRLKSIGVRYVADVESIDRSKLRYIFSIKGVRRHLQVYAQCNYQRENGYSALVHSPVFILGYSHTLLGKQLRGKAQYEDNDVNKYLPFIHNDFDYQAYVYVNPDNSQDYVVEVFEKNE